MYMYVGKSNSKNCDEVLSTTSCGSAALGHMSAPLYINEMLTLVYMV
jgi:hypothetical protein